MKLSLGLLTKIQKLMTIGKSSQVIPGKCQERKGGNQKKKDRKKERKKEKQRKKERKKERNN